MQWFRRSIERRNNEMVKMMNESVVEGNRERVRPKKNLIGVIGKDTRACGLYEDVVRDGEEWKERT